MSEIKTYQIKGMHCASCASTIEKTFKKQAGVASAEANYGTESVAVSYDESMTTPHHLSKSIEPLGYSLVIPETNEMSMTAQGMGMSESEHAAHLGLNQSKKEKLAEISSMRTMIITTTPLVLFTIFVMAWEGLAPFGYAPPLTNTVKEFFHHLLPLIATYVLFVVGKPYLLGVYRFFRYGKANMDSLIGIGTLAAYVYGFVVTALEEPLKAYVNTQNTYYDVTIVVIGFIALGKYLEARSKLKTGDAIEKLLGLQAKTALVLRNGKEQEISINEVVLNDLVIVKPGGKIPVDGVVTEGNSFVDEAMVTGEPMPVEKKPGNNVAAGTINTTGSFTFKATKVGSQTLLAHIIAMVQQAQASKAPIQALADKISSIFVPIVLVLSFVTLVVWLLVGTQFLGFAQALSYGLTAFVGILVIACPCALGLATPTAIIVGVGKGAKEGILIKDAATLEKLYKVNTVVVDKTGTITKGKPELVSINNLSKQTDSEVVAILASLEQKSEHPIAHAVNEYAASKKIKPVAVANFEIIKGKGVKGMINKVEYFAGNIALMDGLGISFDMRSLKKEASQGNTPLILAAKKEIIAIVMVADAIKPEAIQAIQDLKVLGINPIMLTGDNKNTAQAIAKQVGIDDVFGEVLPEDKLKKIAALQKEGFIVAMAGDGVNDAPALAQADVSIAMGTGTDVAIETAGITLLHGDISKLVKAIRLSHITMRGIKQNLFWAFIYNIIGIPIAAGILYPFFGILLSPVLAGIAMAFSSVSVVGNSLRIKAMKL